MNRLVFIGAGAVGGSIAGLVADTGFPVVLVARGEHGKAIQDNGLKLELFDRMLTSHLTCVSTVDAVDWQQGDVAVVATKLNDAQPVLDQLRIVAGPKLPIVCATNGLIAEEWASEQFECVVSMMVWLPATHLRPGEVMLHSDSVRGVLDVGGMNETSHTCASDVARLLREAGFDSIARDNILEWKRAKWITNLGGAAQAMVVDDWMSVLHAAQVEGENVLLKADLPRIPTGELLNRCSSVNLTGVAGFERKGGSTWQSQQRGRPLESAFIEGAMADLGESLGVAVPVNRFLANAALNPRELTAAEALQST
ncbi:MAG: 2-dehydropantoate 2-reductase N-terminal domain-containing protein [Planctomycetota bacterium]